MIKLRRRDAVEVVAVMAGERDESRCGSWSMDMARLGVPSGGQSHAHRDPAAPVHEVRVSEDREAGDLQEGRRRADEGDLSGVRVAAGGVPASRSAGRWGIIALYPAMPEMHANRPGRFERGRFDARPARRLRDKVALGVGAGIAVGGVLPREPVLQRGVFIAAAGVGAQRVAEGQERLGLRVPVLDDVQMMGTGLRPWPQEPQPVVTARDLRPEQPACVSQHRHRSLRVR